MMRFSIHYIQNYCYLFQQYQHILPHFTFQLFLQHYNLFIKFIATNPIKVKKIWKYQLLQTSSRIINIYNKVPVIYLFPMKRFSRKNSLNRSQVVSSQGRIRTEQDDPDLSSSRSTVKNVSFDQESIGRNISSTYSATSLIFTLLKNKLSANLQYSVYKLKNTVKIGKLRDRNVGKIVAIANKGLYRFKLEAFNKIKQQKRREYIKTKAVNILNTCSAGVVRKLLMEGYFGIAKFSQVGLTKQNYKLKEIEAKYRQISIPQQYCLAFRKFLKISPKNIKPFLKITQQTVEPTLLSLTSTLQQKRINKHIPSESELLINSIKNYVLILKDINEKLMKSQNQVAEVNKERGQIFAELEFLRKYENACRKEFQKYDHEVENKLGHLLENSFSESSFKNLQKVLQQQLKVCLTKAENGFQYASRASILKVATILINKRIPTQSALLNPSPSPSPRKKSQTKSETIEQQSSLEQSDILQYINKILEELIKDMKNSGNTIQSLKGCGCEEKFISNFKVKNMVMPELAKIHEKFQEIKAMYCQKAFNCFQLENTNKQLKNSREQQDQNNKNNLKNVELLELTEKISELEQKLRDLQTKHESEKQIIYLEEQQNQRELEETIKQIEEKLEQSLEQIIIKDSKIQELTYKFEEKSLKFNQINDEFRRFRKMMKGLNKSMQEKNKSVNEIIERSLSKSKASVSNKLSVQKKKPKTISLFDTSITYKSPTKNTKKQEQSIANILYNIMIKYKQLPDSSQSATQLWSRLNSICQLSGFQLSEKLEEYVVNWMKQNSKIGVKEPKKLEVAQNLNRTPPKQKIYRDIRLRTAKNTKRE